MEVSRETLIARHFPDGERIRAYANFLETAGIERGLIGPREADRIWERHIFNCLPVTTLFLKGLPSLISAQVRDFPELLSP
jgi:16S rRNA (guanine527-N7)-methyltransferase